MSNVIKLSDQKEKAINKPADEVLPVLGENQYFVCEEGCGICRPIEFDFCYSRATNLETGEVKSLSHIAYKSSCCGGVVNVWDEVKQDIVITP